MHCNVCFHISQVIIPGIFHCFVDVVVPLIESSNVNFSDFNSFASFDSEQLQSFGQDVSICVLLHCLTITCVLVGCHVVGWDYSTDCNRSHLGYRVVSVLLLLWAV